MHTLKGMARTLGFAAIGSPAATAEAAFEAGSDADLAAIDTLIAELDTRQGADPAVGQVT